MYDQTILDRHARMVTNAKFGKNSLSAPFLMSVCHRRKGIVHSYAVTCLKGASK